MTQAQLTYDYVEFAVNTYRSNKVFKISEIRSADFIGKTDCYMSMFRYPEQFKQHVDITRSVSGYGGLISFDFIYVDFDCAENIEQAKHDLQNFIQYGLGIFLTNEDFEKLRISFSGAKGFTLAIPRSFLGDVEPCNNMNLKVKAFIKNLTELIRDENAIMLYTVDFQIYDKVRVIRLNNTINSKSGLYKIPLLYSELINFTVEEIKELAKQQRTVSVENNYVVNEQLKEIFEQEPEKEYNEIDYNKTNDDLFKPVPEGKRNSTGFEIASRLNFHNNPTSYIRSVLQMWNRTLPDPMDDDEIESIINSVKKYEPKDKTTSAGLSRESFLNFEDREVQYKKFIEDLSHKKVYTGFDMIDKKLRGIRPGNIVTLLAQTGIGKSAICQNIFRHFLNTNDDLILFFSIEMDSIDVFERELQLELDMTGFDIENIYQANQSLLTRVNIDKQNRFITVIEPIDINQIPNYVNACENIFGKKVALVCIDYLGLIYNSEFKKIEYDRVTNNISKIRDYGKQSRIPYFVIAQIKRDGIKERINLFSAKSSGDIEQASHIMLSLEKITADNIKLFDVDEYGITDNTVQNMYKMHEDLLCLSILKNRRGGKEEVLLRYDRRNLRMRQYINTEHTEQTAF